MVRHEGRPARARRHEFLELGKPARAEAVPTPPGYLEQRRRTQYAPQAIHPDASQSLGLANKNVNLADLGIYGILFRDEESDELQAFASRTLAPLVNYDKQNNTELLKTLDTYFRHQTKLAETARKLHIHVNTLRQRLDRIGQILDTSLDDSLVNLNLQLALRVYEIMPKEDTSA